MEFRNLKLSFIVAANHKHDLLSHQIHKLESLVNLSNIQT